MNWTDNGRGQIHTAALMVAFAGLSGACNRDPGGSAVGVGDGAEQTGADDGATETGGAAATSGATDGSSDGNVPPLYDVGGIPDVPGVPNGCGGGGGNGAPAFSYIWISNSGQDTVSKIDTVTLEEVGRYRTHPTGGNPSRTSVSLNGDVAVANRNGGIVKFYANRAHCEDRNGNGVIDTSTGAGDILAWEDEECRAWFSDFEYASQRPVAWTPGQWNAGSCRYEDTLLWTSGTNNGANDKDCGMDPACKRFPEEPPIPGGKGTGVDVLLLDGEDGSLVELVNVPGVSPDSYGLYGGAVDSQGNFWGSQIGMGSLVRVNLSDFEYSVFPMAASGYGITVDAEGYVWTCSYDVGRFDPASETWQTAQVGGSGGCMEDGNGTLWLAGGGLTGVDTETLAVVKTITLDGGGGGMGKGGYVHGVSIDFAGNVWGVGMGTTAYRVDPVTEDVETVTGLVSPYTYSDMTGFALANAGGWTPAG